MIKAHLQRSSNRQVTSCWSSSRPISAVITLWKVCKTRVGQRRKGRQESRSKQEHLDQAPPWPVPVEPSVPLSTCKTITRSHPSRSPDRLSEERGLQHAMGMGLSIGYKGKGAQIAQDLTMSCLTRKPRVGERRGLRWFSEDQVWGNWGVRRQKCINSCCSVRGLPGHTMHLISAACTTLLLSSCHSLLGWGSLPGEHACVQGLTASTGIQMSEHESGGLRVCGESNLRERGCARSVRVLVTIKPDQPVQGRGGSLKASSGCEHAWVSLRTGAQQSALVNHRLNSKSTTWNGLGRLCWLLGSWKMLTNIFPTLHEAWGK